ncbi:MAG: hypothetical protein KAJ79_02820, partial [Candidatus Omnitrophica bacterium]|nr:hypothetical protein [Candidatus Omnitrophota bacterium]
MIFNILPSISNLSQNISLFRKINYKNFKNIPARASAISHGKVIILSRDFIYAENYGDSNIEMFCDGGSLLSAELGAEIRQAAVLLTGRKDFSQYAVGAKTEEEWEQYLNEKIFGYNLIVQNDFLKVLISYLRNEIPEYILFENLLIHDELFFELMRLTSRFHLWNDRAILDFASYLDEVLRRIERQTIEPPVVIEVASGYGDLSYGLKREFPGIKIVSTDGFVDEDTDALTGFYDPGVIEERGVKKLFADDISDGSFRRILNISQETPVIIIGANLPFNAGVESALLNQKSVDELLLIYTEKSTEKVTGDLNVMPNREVWNLDFLYPDENVWISGLIYGSKGKNSIDDLTFDPKETSMRESTTVKIYALSRKRESVQSSPGALKIIDDEELMIRDEISASDFLNWLYSYIGFSIRLKIVKQMYEKVTLTPQEIAEFLKILDLLYEKATHPTAREDIKDIQRAFSRLRKGADSESLLPSVQKKNDGGIFHEVTPLHRASAGLNLNNINGKKGGAKWYQIILQLTISWFQKRKKLFTSPAAMKTVEFISIAYMTANLLKLITEMGGKLSTRFYQKELWIWQINTSIRVLPMMFITSFHNLLTKGDSGGQSQRIVPFVAGIALVDGGKSLFSEEGFEFKDNEIEMGWIDWVIGAPAFTVILLAELTIFLASKFISTIELENNFIIRTLSRLPLKTAIVFIMFVIVLSAGLSIPVAANADTVTVNDTIDKQVNITNFNNEKIIEDLRENRGISFVKNQTLGDLIVYTEIASKDATTNGQILYVVDTNRGFAVEYIDSEPFIMSFNDGRESLFLEIDEDLGKGALKVRDDETGILYDYREKNIGDYKVLIIEDPLPVEFLEYLDENGGHFKKEGLDAYYHVDENGENKRLVFKKEESSRGVVFVTYELKNESSKGLVSIIYDLDSFEDILMPKEGIFVNGNEKITFSEMFSWIMVDSDGVEWLTYPFHYYTGEEDKRVAYISLSERFVNKQDELEEDVLVNETIIPIETPEVQINETPGFKFSIAIVSLFLALGLRNRRCKKTQGSKFIAKDVDGGNRIDTNLPLNLPYSLPIMLLFGLTSFSGKNVENYIGMSLAGRGNIIRIKFKTTLNSVIVFQNSNFVNEFMKWLARLETSPPGINAFQVKYQVYPHLILSRLKRRYKTIKLQFIESLREISVYLVFLINTTINCTPNKVIATSHGYIRTTSHGKAFSFSGVDLVLFLNRFVEALF